EHQQPQLRFPAAQLLRRLDACAPRHRYVQDREVNVLGERLLDRLGAVIRLCDDPQVRLRVEHLSEAGTDDRVVVCHQDSRHERDWHQRPPAGTSSLTSTPPSRPRLTARAPPTSTARSRIPRRPPWPFAAVSSSPRPSSTTLSTTLSAPGSSSTTTRDACACRAMLVR